MRRKSTIHGSDKREESSLVGSIYQAIEFDDTVELDLLVSIAIVIRFPFTFLRIEKLSSVDECGS